MKRGLQTLNNDSDLSKLEKSKIRSAVAMPFGTGRAHNKSISQVYEENMWGELMLHAAASLVQDRRLLHCLNCVAHWMATNEV